MRNHLPSIFVALSLAAGGAYAATESFYPDATADQAIKVGQKDVMRAKFYSSGDKIRTETKRGGETSISLIDRAAKKMWIIMPTPAGCLERPLLPDAKSPIFDPSAMKEELVGDDMVAGHPAKKYKVTTTVDGKTYDQYVWRATDLKGFPIRAAAADGSYETTFENVVLGAPDPKLFQPPKDCNTTADFGKMMHPK